jgi:uncharacterized hydrophobic protein (TIGR00271 family)
MALSSIGALLHGGPVGRDDYVLLADKLYFDREGTNDPYVRFSVLLVLSTVIATGGVVADSTATVIGAMIIAPLMTPIMATALAVVTGDHEELARSLALVVGGAAVAVAVAWVLGNAASEVLDPATNSQISARATPGLVDLYLALATGAVGAFALSRENISDALPGVAIAISLVPPLAVVGTCLAIGDTSAAGGAALLFLTNVTAILVAGGAVLAVMGYGAQLAAAHARRSRLVAALTIAVGVVLIVGPLAVTSAKAVDDAALERTATQRAEDWLEGTSLELTEVDADGNKVELVIVGSDEPPPVNRLAGWLRAQRSDVVVHVRIVPEIVLGSTELEQE